MQKTCRRGALLSFAFYMLVPSLFAAPNCEVIITKVENKISTSSDFKLGKRSRFVVNESSDESRSESMLLLGSGKSAEMSFDDERVSVTCILKYSAADITFEIKQKSGSVASSLEIAYGAQSEIGGHLKELSEKANTKALPDGVTFQKGESKIRSRFLMKISQKSL